MKEVILKLQEYENMLKEIQSYLFDCPVTAQNEHIAWINKINDVLFTKPKNTHNLANSPDANQRHDEACPSAQHLLNQVVLRHHHKI